MTASDNRTEFETTFGELDAMDIGRTVSFRVGLDTIYGTLTSFRCYGHEDMMGRVEIVLLGEGRVYGQPQQNPITIHKPGIYGPNHPIVGFHNVG